MKTSIIAIIGFSMVLAFAPFVMAQETKIDAKAQQELSRQNAMAQSDADAKAALVAKEQAIKEAKAKVKEADAAKKLAKEKAKAVADAREALLKEQKKISQQKAQLEAQSLKNAERKANEELKARAASEKKLKLQADQKAADEARAKQAAAESSAREAKVKSRIEARAGTMAQPASDAQSVSGNQVAVTSKNLEKDKWRVALGVLYRRIGGRSFKTSGSYSRNAGIAQKSTDDHWVGPAGSGGAAGDRTYDNGYVGSDDYSGYDGGTWNWGYKNGNQVKGNQMEFTGVDRVWREYTRQTTVADSDNFDDANYSGGLMLEVERYMAQTRFVDYGLSLGLSRAQTFETSINGVNTFNDNQRWDTYQDLVVDSYDITGLGITPKSTPYNGSRAVEGPVISTTQMNRRGLGSELVSTETYRAYNSVNESLDMDLSTLSLGMSIKGTYELLYLMGSTGPTLNIVEKDATYEETLYASANGGVPQTLNYWNNSSSGTECLFGYYVQAELGVHIYRGLHLGIFGRYDWLETVSGTVGPSSYQVNPSGGSMGGTLGLSF